MSIVSFDGDEDKIYCNAKNCGGLVVQLNKNGDSVCTLCEHVYSQNSTLLHKKKLKPDNEEADPMFVPMTNYKQGRGRSIIDYEETFY